MAMITPGANNSTLILKMDLTRPAPIYSEQVPLKPDEQDGPDEQEQ
jgi:hypothetical protein